MGRKINPLAFRLNIFNNWISNWCSKYKNYAISLKEDFIIRQFIIKLFKSLFIISDIQIEKTNLNFKNYIILTITFFKITLSSKVNTMFLDLIINSNFNSLLFGHITNYITKFIKTEFNLNSIIKFYEVDSPYMDAKLLSQFIAFFLKKQFNEKIVIEYIINQLKDLNLRGAKIKLSGRIAGEEKATSLSYSYGKYTRNTICNNVKYSFYPFHTIYGKMSIKIWLYI